MKIIAIQDKIETQSKDFKEYSKMILEMKCEMAILRKNQTGAGQSPQQLSNTSAGTL